MVLFAASLRLKPGAPEPQVMDYQTQQHKLYPYLAMASGFRFVAKELFELYFKGMAGVKSGDDTLIPELHALSLRTEGIHSLICQPSE